MARGVFVCSASRCLQYCNQGWPPVAALFPFPTRPRHPTRKETHTQKHQQHAHQQTKNESPVGSDLCRERLVVAWPSPPVPRGCCHKEPILTPWALAHFILCLLRRSFSSTLPFAPPARALTAADIAPEGRRNTAAYYSLGRARYVPGMVPGFGRALAAGQLELGK